MISVFYELSQINFITAYVAYLKICTALIKLNPVVKKLNNLEFQAWVHSCR